MTTKQQKQSRNQGNSRKLLIFFACLFMLEIGFAQNLVPNAGFEIHDICPSMADQIQFAVNWSKVSEINTTPDYYNSCSASNSMGVPQNYFFYQPDTRNCGAYAGLVTRTNNPNEREDIGVQLIQPMVVGQKYFISFLTAMGGSDDGTYYYESPSNNIGLRLSTISYNSSNPAPIDNFSHLHSTNIINDTANWTRISGSIIADSAYSFLSMGNFYDDANTDTILLNCANCLNAYSYYLIDNICISTDSTFCNSGIDDVSCNVSVSELSFISEINVFPNPANDEIDIFLNDFQAEIIQLTDLMGQVIYVENILNKDYVHIDLSSHPSGVYFLNFLNEKKNKIISKKIVKL